MEKSEIERVTAIHAFLDKCAAAVGDQEGEYCFRDSTGKRIDYTADEVRAWPEMKAKMVACLDRFRDAKTLGCWYGLHAGTTQTWRMIRATTFKTGDAVEPIRRGLCLYREMLATPAEAKSEEWVPRVGEMIRVRVGSGVLRSDWQGMLMQVAECEDPKVVRCKHGPGPMDYVRFNPKDVEPAPSAPAKADYRFVGMDPALTAPADVKEACRRFNVEHEPRTWDSDKYNGIVSSNLDDRIAAARADLDLTTAQRRSRLGFPHPGRNFALNRKDHD